MMKPIQSLLAASGFAATLALCAIPAAAHHSFGHYNMIRTSEIEGVISKWEWGNPHCWLFVDVAAGGKTTTYGFELQSPGELMRRGWKRTSIKPGDKVKVAFRPMKDGTPAGLMVRVSDSAGKLIGNPPPGPPPGPLPATPPAAP